MAGVITHSYRWYWLLLWCVGLAACGPSLPEQVWQVKAIGALERFARFAPLSGDDEVVLAAARNEYEGFQFVIRAGSHGISNVQVTISALRDARGNVLDTLQVFRQRYVKVTTPSPFSPYAPQEWPDILLPAANPANATLSPAYRAFPQNLLAGENLPVWVDVFVPATAAPGEYHGKVTVTADGVPALELPITLNVWNFTLPQRLPLRTVFGTNGYRVAEVYGFERTGTNAENNRLIRTYNDFLLDHRLSPESFWDASPEADVDGHPNFARQFAGLGTVTQNMQYYMQVKHASAYTYVFA
ncbi:MAG: hypothetical protein ACK4RS_04415, partial [Thiothrix sp.]